MDIDKLRQNMEKKFKTVKWSGHPCGYGSKFGKTQNIRNFLPKIVADYNIQSIADAGAGDLSWISHVEWPHEVKYMAYDIYPRHKDVIKFDITSQVIPTVDLILCRYVLNHLDSVLRQEAIKRFCESDSKFILLTTGKTSKMLQTFKNIWGEPLIPLIREDIGTRIDWHYGLWRIN